MFPSGVSDVGSNIPNKSFAHGLKIQLNNSQSACGGPMLDEESALYIGTEDYNSSFTTPCMSPYKTPEFTPCFFEPRNNVVNMALDTRGTPPRKEGAMYPSRNTESIRGNLQASTNALLSLSFSDQDVPLPEPNGQTQTKDSVDEKSLNFPRDFRGEKGAMSSQITLPQQVLGDLDRRKRSFSKDEKLAVTKKDAFLGKKLMNILFHSTNKLAPSSSATPTNSNATVIFSSSHPKSSTSRPETSNDFSEPAISCAQSDSDLQTGTARTSSGTSPDRLGLVDISRSPNGESHSLERESSKDRPASVIDSGDTGPVISSPSNGTKPTNQHSPNHNIAPLNLSVSLLDTNQLPKANPSTPKQQQLAPIPLFEVSFRDSTESHILNVESEKHSQFDDRSDSYAIAHTTVNGSNVESSKGATVISISATSAMHNHSVPNEPAENMFALSDNGRVQFRTNFSTLASVPQCEESMSLSARRSVLLQLPLLPSSPLSSSTTDASLSPSPTSEPVTHHPQSQRQGGTVAEGEVPEHDRYTAHLKSVSMSSSCDMSPVSAAKVSAKSLVNQGERNALVKEDKPMHQVEEVEKYLRRSDFPSSDELFMLLSRKRYLEDLIQGKRDDVPLGQTENGQEDTYIPRLDDVSILGELEAITTILDRFQTSSDTLSSTVTALPSTIPLSLEDLQSNVEETQPQSSLKRIRDLLEVVQPHKRFEVVKEFLLSGRSLRRTIHTNAQKSMGSSSISSSQPVADSSTNHQTTQLSVQPDKTDAAGAISRLASVQRIALEEKALLQSQMFGQVAPSDDRILENAIHDKSLPRVASTGNQTNKRKSAEEKNVPPQKIIEFLLAEAKGDEAVKDCLRDHRELSELIATTQFLTRLPSTTGPAIGKKVHRFSEHSAQAKTEVPAPMTMDSTLRHSPSDTSSLRPESINNAEEVAVLDSSEGTVSALSGEEEPTGHRMRRKSLLLSLRSSLSLQRRHSRLFSDAHEPLGEGDVQLQSLAAAPTNSARNVRPNVDVISPQFVGNETNKRAIAVMAKIDPLNNSVIRPRALHFGDAATSIFASEDKDVQEALQQLTSFPPNPNYDYASNIHLDRTKGDKSTLRRGRSAHTMKTPKSGIQPIETSNTASNTSAASVVGTKPSQLPVLRSRPATHGFFRSQSVQATREKRTPMQRDVAPSAEKRVEHEKGEIPMRPRSQSTAIAHATTTRASNRMYSKRETYGHIQPRVIGVHTTSRDTCSTAAPMNRAKDAPAPTQGNGVRPNARTIIVSNRLEHKVSDATSAAAANKESLGMNTVRNHEKQASSESSKQLRKEKRSKVDIREIIARVVTNLHSSTASTSASNSSLEIAPLKHPPINEQAPFEGASSTAKRPTSASSATSSSSSSPSTRKDSPSMKISPSASPVRTPSVSHSLSTTFDAPLRQTAGESALATVPSEPNSFSERMQKNLKSVAGSPKIIQPLQDSAIDAQEVPELSASSTQRATCAFAVSAPSNNRIITEKDTLDLAIFYKNSLLTQIDQTSKQALNALPVIQKCKSETRRYMEQVQAESSILGPIENEYRQVEEEYERTLKKYQEWNVVGMEFAQQVLESSNARVSDLKNKHYTEYMILTDQYVRDEMLLDNKLQELEQLNQELQELASTLEEQLHLPFANDSLTSPDYVEDVEYIFASSRSKQTHPITRARYGIGVQGALFDLPGAYFTSYPTLPMSGAPFTHPYLLLFLQPPLPSVSGISWSFKANVEASSSVIGNGESLPRIVDNSEPTVVHPKSSLSDDRKQLLQLLDTADSIIRTENERLKQIAESVDVEDNRSVANKEQETIISYHSYFRGFLGNDGSERFHQIARDVNQRLQSDDIYVPPTVFQQINMPKVIRSLLLDLQMLLQARLSFVNSNDLEPFIHGEGRMQLTDSQVLISDSTEPFCAQCRVLTTKFTLVRDVLTLYQVLVYATTLLTLSFVLKNEHVGETVMVVLNQGFSEFNAVWNELGPFHLELLKLLRIMEEDIDFQFDAGATQNISAIGCCYKDKNQLLKDILESLSPTTSKYSDILRQLYVSSMEPAVLALKEQAINCKANGESKSENSSARDAIHRRILAAHGNSQPKARIQSRSKSTDPSESKERRTSKNSTSLNSTRTNAVDARSKSQVQTKRAETKPVVSAPNADSSKVEKGTLKCGPRLLAAMLNVHPQVIQEWIRMISETEEKDPISNMENVTALHLSSEMNPQPKIPELQTDSRVESSVSKLRGKTLLQQILTEYEERMATIEAENPGSKSNAQKVPSSHKKRLEVTSGSAMQSVRSSISTSRARRLPSTNSDSSTLSPPKGEVSPEIALNDGIITASEVPFQQNFLKRFVSLCLLSLNVLSLDILDQEKELSQLHEKKYKETILALHQGQEILSSLTEDIDKIMMKLKQATLEIESLN